MSASGPAPARSPPPPERRSKPFRPLAVGFTLPSTHCSRQRCCFSQGAHSSGMASDKGHVPICRR